MSSQSSYQMNARQVATPPPTQHPAHPYGTRYQQQQLQQQQQHTGQHQKTQVNAVSQEVPPADSAGELNTIYLTEPWPLAADHHESPLPSAVDLPPAVAHVSVRVGDQDVSALLDTGATHSFITAACLAKMSPPPATMPVTKSFNAVGATISVTSKVILPVQLTTPQGRILTLDHDFNILQHALHPVILGFPFISITGIGLPSATGPAPEELEESAHWPIQAPATNTAATSTFATPVPPALAPLVKEFSTLFDDALPAGGALLPPLHLHLTGDLPRSIPPRRLSPALREEMAAIMAKLTEQGIVQPSLSPFASPAFLVRKPDGGYRKVVDYRTVNKLLQHAAFPLPNNQELIACLEGAAIYAKIDFRSGFHQLPLAADSAWLTAFSTPDGVYEYTRVPMGLSVAPQWFQASMTDLLRDLIGHTLVVFIDDITVFASDIVELEHRLRVVFKRLNDVHLRLRADKCSLGVDTVHFLGFVVDRRGLRLGSERTEAIANLPTPTTGRELHSQLGMFNFLRNFVPNFSAVASPLYALTKTRGAITFTAEMLEAYRTIRAAIAAAPLLRHLDYTRDIYLHTDASTVGIGAFLFQRSPKDNSVEPVQFISKALSPAASRWSTMEIELYAIYYSIITLESRLLGHHFHLLTDHRNLTFLARSPTPKISRWNLRLQEYSFDVIHVPGADNVVADALSRNPLPLDEASIATPSSVMALTADDKTTIAAMHNAHVGHCGVQETMRRLRSANITHIAQHTVAEYIAACGPCQKIRHASATVATPYTSPVYEPFESIIIDRMGPFPVDAQGNQYILVVMCAFLRFVLLFPVRTAEATEVAGVLLQVFGLFGPPRFLQSDQGTDFLSNIVSELLALCGVGRRVSVAYSHEENGLIERVNREVLAHLRFLVMDPAVKDHWSATLPLVQYIVNNRHHSTLGTAPSTLLFAGAVTANRQLIVPPAKDGGETSMSEYAQTLLATQSRLLQRAAAFQQAVTTRRLQTRQDAKSDKTPTSFAPGDLVLITYPERAPTKLMPPWSGPYKVVERIGHSDNYVCQSFIDHSKKTCHISRLKVFRPDLTDDILALAASDVQEYEVEEVVSHRYAGPVPAGSKARRNRKDFFFTIKYAGFGPEHNDELAYNDVSKLAALDRYIAKHPELSFMASQPKHPSK